MEAGESVEVLLGKAPSGRIEIRLPKELAYLPSNAAPGSLGAAIGLDLFGEISWIRQVDLPEGESAVVIEPAPGCELQPTHFSQAVHAFLKRRGIACSVTTQPISETCVTSMPPSIAPLPPAAIGSSPPGERRQLAAISA